MSTESNFEITTAGLSFPISLPVILESSPSPSRSKSDLPMPPTPPENLPPEEPSGTPEEVAKAKSAKFASAEEWFTDDSASELTDASQQGELFELDPPPWELESDDAVPHAGIVFAEAPYGPFHYRIPTGMVESLEPGMRVQVPLGRGNRKVSGWVIEVGTGGRPARSMKDVLELVDSSPLCSASMIKLVLWMAHYYQAPAGQVFDALIPAGVRVRRWYP